MSKKTKIAVLSKGIASKTDLKVFLEIDEMYLKPAENTQIEYVVGWGRKGNTKQARIYAEDNRLDYFSLGGGSFKEY